MAFSRPIGAGDLLGDRYGLTRLEWTSALGPVWLARDRVLDRPVFVQLLSADLAADDGARRAFQKAAARTAQVAHHGLLQVFDIGEDPPFVVFEHAVGGSLERRLQSGRLRATDAARAALAVARGLEAMHAHGLWHGSLSPATVLFDAEGRAKILADGATETLAHTAGPAVATGRPPGYDPPEPDPQPADVDRYALAALLYQMVTGAPPGTGARTRTMRRAVPAPVDALLERALAPDPAARPTLDEFVGMLAPLARIVPPDARRPRFSSSEFRWLSAVVVIVAIAAAAVTVGVRFAQDLAGRRAAPSASAAARTSGRPVAIAAARDFDPPPGNGSEHPDQVGRAIDGDPLSAWETVGYKLPSLAPKKGVGLLFDLGTVRRIRAIRVRTARPGWDATIRVADAAGTRVEDFRAVTSFTASSDGTVSLPGATAARFVLLWITKLVDDGSGSDLPNRAAVSEVEFIG